MLKAQWDKRNAIWDRPGHVLLVFKMNSGWQARLIEDSEVIYRAFPYNDAQHAMYACEENALQRWGQMPQESQDR